MDRTILEIIKFQKRLLMYDMPELAPGDAPAAPWGVKYPPHLGTSKLPPHTKFGGPNCKCKETRAKSWKLPPGGGPAAPKASNTPYTLELLSYPHIQNLGALTAKVRKLEQKVENCPKGTPLRRPGASGGVKYPPHLGTSKLPHHTKFWGPKCKGKETRAKSVGKVPKWWKKNKKKHE